MNNLIVTAFDVTAGVGGFNMVAAGVWLTIGLMVFVAVVEYVAGER